MNVSEVMKNLKANLNAPDVRCIFLKKAQDEFNAGNELNSVFYQTEALCLGYHNTYGMKINAKEHALNTRPYQIRSHDFHDDDDDDLIKFARCEIEIDETKYSDEGLQFQNDPKKGIESITKSSQLLPKEWTVLQLCKNYNSESSISLKSEILTHQDSIYLTVLKNAYDLHPEPICIKIDMSTSGADIFKKFALISADLKYNDTTFEGETTKSAKLKYWKHLGDAENSINIAVEELKKMIGPWKCFFVGPTLSSHQHQEKAILKVLKLFCTENDLDNRQYVILSSLSCHSNLLTANDITVACKALTDNAALSDRIRRYLLQTRDDNFHIQLECSPCMLIVDELLDHFLWEMINPRQEFCRLSSFYMLNSLYKKYQHKISNGFVKMSIDTAKWILNPDKSLIQMEKRISNFISHWAPSFECSVGEKPTADDIRRCLTEFDVFIYSGHGSGLQFFNGHKITKIDSSSVVFLLGCDSTRLRSDGLHSELNGAHLYYLATQCPAVIGSLILAFDRQLDSMSAHILTSWIPSKEQFNWKSVDLELWLKNGKIQKLKDDNRQRDIYEPRLSLIIAKLRCNLTAKLYVRGSLIYRGLPLWNINAESKNQKCKNA